eukprot:TRINITY_DN391_c0_g3_i1.p2 TRINITY_DN391_c0_g3~~TRINITY_DN391_c0_g3_i1.p2  ORF type:complete len:351 (+),score=177.53 TRINITY_DN391_c0_g3_i1:68-1054(+)
MSATRSYSEKKQGYFKKMNEYLDKYEKVMFVSCDNVTSRQFNEMRIGLRPGGKYPVDGHILMGKNTMMVKVLKQRAEEAPENELRQKQYEQMDKVLKENTGMIFTNGDLQAIKEMVSGNVVQAPAKVNALAPCDVTIPAGGTGLEPGQTSFFQALNIHTKIAKGMIEILNAVTVIKEGERVGPSAATLLQKMKMRPFFYGLKMKYVCEGASFYDPRVLDMTVADKTAMVQRGISRLTAVSLAIGWTNKASFPHAMMYAFKNVLSVSLGTDYDFPEFDGAQLKQDILSGKLTASAAPAAAASGAPAAAAPAPAPVEESEEEDTDFGLFD